ncbi:MAG: TolC family protein [bacterium]
MKIFSEKKFHYTLIGILAILVFSQIAFAQNKSTLTLSDAVQIALKNNREIAILQKDIEKAKGEKKAASRIFQHNPEIAGEVKNRRSGNQNIRDFEFSLSQSVGIGRQRHYRMKIAELYLLKAQFQLENEKFTIAEKIKGIFIDLTALNEKLQAVQDILEVEEGLFQWLTIRSAQGEISSVALNTVGLEVLRTKEKLLDIHRAILSKKRGLEWVMNTSLPEGREIVYGWPEFPANIPREELERYAEEHNPDVKIALVDSRIAEASLKLAKAGHVIPGLSFSFIRSREDNDNLIGFGSSLPLPLFNRRTGEITTAKAEKERATLELKRIHEKIFSEINRYCESSTILEQQRKLFVEKILPIPQHNLDQIKMRYQRGELDLMTLERFWDSWIETKIEYAEFLQQYYHMLCRIELLSGAELKKIVKKYEPKEQ